MYGRSFIEKNSNDDSQRQRSLEVHQQKLQSIMRRKVKLKAFEVDEILRRRNYDKLKNFHFQHQEKKLNINRENKVLLDKLVQISRGRHLTIEPSKPKPSDYQTRAQSINTIKRKMEGMKIQEQNQQFAKRLFDSQGAISNKSHLNEFKEHVKMRNNLQKLSASKKQASKAPFYSYSNIPKPKARGKSGLLPSLDKRTRAQPGSRSEYTLENNLISNKDQIRKKKHSLPQNMQGSISFQQKATAMSHRKGELTEPFINEINRHQIMSKCEGYPSNGRDPCYQ